MENNPKNPISEAREWLGDYLKQRRTQIGWSYETLSQKSFLSIDQIKEIEAGKTQNIDLYIIILASMQVSIYFSGGDMEKPPSFGLFSMN